MSGNDRVVKGKTDRRVVRTRDRLGDALVDLVVEKPFDAITVQDVTDRAGVGRSTFYSHYRDKDDLFQSDVDEFLERVATMLSRSGESSDRVAPVRELFAHVAEERPLYAALVESGKIRDFLELAQEHFARAIEARIAERPRASTITAETRAPVAQAFAGALLSLMAWWLDRGTPGSPAEMDDLFHRLVWTGVGSEVGSPSP